MNPTIVALVSGAVSLPTLPGLSKPTITNITDSSPLEPRHRPRHMPAPRRHFLNTFNPLRRLPQRR